MTDVLEAILNHVDSIDEKVKTKEHFKSLMFMVKYKSTYDLPTNTAVFTFNFERSLDLPSLDYEISLMDIETYYSFPNIDRNSNRMKFKVEDEDWQEIVIPTGSYSLKSLDTEINNQLGDYGHKNKIRVRASEATLKCEMRLHQNVYVDFTIDNSVNSILAFDPGVYGGRTTKKYTSQNNVQILDVNSIYINCDLISNSYVNGLPSPVIYSFFPNVAPGYKIIEKPNSLVFLPINKKFISSVTVWLTNQNGKILNFQGEEIAIRFYLRRIQPIDAYIFSIIKWG